jgi:hypothetical protein
MKVEAYIFGVNAAFFTLVAPAYWFITYDPTGTAALIMTALLTLLVTMYLGVHASRMKEPRPEDTHDAEVADGAGELGFFPPYSWWPLWAAATAAVAVYGLAFGAWWLFVIGLGLGSVALTGWIFEYYRGEHAH